MYNVYLNSTQTDTLNFFDETNLYTYVNLSACQEAQPEWFVHLLQSLTILHGAVLKPGYDLLRQDEHARWQPNISKASEIVKTRVGLFHLKVDLTFRNRLFLRHHLSRFVTSSG